MKRSYVYILECADQSYYVGLTTELERRMWKHQTGFYPNSYTASRRPVKLVYYCEFTNIIKAIKKEKQLKRWSKEKKEALINGDFDLLKKLSKKKFE